MIIKTIESAKRIIKIVFGFTILFIGILLLILPGPGILTIIFALFVLSAEYAWARRLKKRFQKELKITKQNIGKKF